MGLHAAEQLVAELAANQVGTDFHNTEEQNELNIPPFLVYLLGIVIAEHEYQQSNGKKQNQAATVREKRFLELQKQYLALTKNASVNDAEQQTQHVSSLSELRPYKLTTRMFPSKHQQIIIKRDLQKESEKLESVSNEALEALLMEEVVSSSSHQSSKKKKERSRNTKKQKNRQQLSSETNVDADAKKDGQTRKKTNTIIEGTATVLQHRSVDKAIDKNVEVEEQKDLHDDADEGCPSPSSASDNANESTSNLPTRRSSLDADSGNPVKRLTWIKNAENDHISSDGASSTYVGSQDEKIRSHVNCSSHPQSFARNNLPSKNTSGDHFGPHLSAQLSKQIQRSIDLEKDLAEANRRLVEERLEHTKALRIEKERYENMIQALQLRLYISENKRRTYEEALETHIQSVAAVNNGGSAIRDIASDEERIPSSPSLISKVLEKQRVNGYREI